MRKLIIIADSDPRTTVVGGVGIYAKYLAENLCKKFEVVFVGKNNGFPSRDTKYDVIISNKSEGQNNVAFYLSLLRTSKKIITDKNSIIHSQRPDWVVPFKNHQGFKIFTLHGSHYKNMKVKKGIIMRLLYRFLEKKAFMIADKIIAVDSETKKEYSEKYPSFANKIVVVPLGIDTKTFKPNNKKNARKKLGISLNKDVFLYVGRFSKEKNIDLMIKSLQPGEKLLLIGKGDEEQKLRMLAKGKDVEFVKPLNHDKLVHYYNAADILLLFSDHEGLPTAVLESMACGTPVVATKVGELPNIIINGKNGYIISGHHRAMMSLALRKSEDLKEECIKTASKYDWKQISKKIEETYK